MAGVWRDGVAICKRQTVAVEPNRPTGPLGPSEHGPSHREEMRCLKLGLSCLRLDCNCLNMKEPPPAPSSTRARSRLHSDRIVARSGPRVTRALPRAQAPQAPPPQRREPERQQDARVVAVRGEDGRVGERGGCVGFWWMSTTTGSCSRLLWLGTDACGLVSAFGFRFGFGFEDVSQ